jgi:hypothetical protein
MQANNMSNDKQSSLEWFAKESWKLRIQLENKEITMGEYCVTYYDLFDKAKALHKEEIEDAVYWGNIKGYDEHKRTCIDDEDQQYYNETFNPKEK